MASTWTPDRRGTAALAVLGLLAAACGGLSGSSTIGGSASLGRVVAEDAFYDAGNDQVLGDARLVAARPLASFDVSDSGSRVVDGSVAPLGELGELRVGTWLIDDSDLGLLDCVGYRVGERSTGSECGQPGATTGDPKVVFELACADGEPPEWRAFTLGDTVTALRLEVEGGVPVVGADPEGTGLVAAEAIGSVSRMTVQTTDGEVRLVEVEAACPAS